MAQRPPIQAFSPSSSLASLTERSEVSEKTNLKNYHAFATLSCFLGVASLVAWNACLVTMMTVEVRIFPGMPLSGASQVIYTSGMFIGNVYMVSCGQRQMGPMVSSFWFNGLGTILCATIAVIVFYGAETYWGYITFLCLVGAISLTLSVLIPIAFHIAAAINATLCSAVSVGQGLAAVFVAVAAYASIHSFSEELFGGKQVCATVFGVAACCHGGGIIALYLMNRLSHDKFNLWGKYGRPTQDVSGGQLLAISHQIFVELTAVFLPFLVSFAIFPAFCLQWPSSMNQEMFGVTLVVIFVFGDIVGRYLPRLMLIPRSLLHMLSFLRILFIPLYAAIYHAPLDSTLGSLACKFSVHTVMAVTNGWITSCAFIVGSNAVTHQGDRESALFLLAVLNVMGICAGSFLYLLMAAVGYAPVPPPLVEPSGFLEPQGSTIGNKFEEVNKASQYLVLVPGT